MPVAEMSSWDRVLLEAKEQGRREGIQQAEKVVSAARYGAPSSWPNEYPRSWMHPPCWELDRVPTPGEAAMHDNGVFDAVRAIRTLIAKEPTDG